MTTVIRLNSAIEGNFSQKKIVTPIGLKPIFSFNANRTLMSSDSSVLPSDYGELSYATALKEIFTKDPNHKSNMREDFYGRFLELSGRGFSEKNINSPSHHKQFIAAAIKFRITKPMNSNNSRMLTLRLGPDAKYVYISPNSLGNGVIIHTNMGSKDFAAINSNITNEVITIVVVFAGKDSMCLIDGAFVYKFTLDDNPVDSNISTINVNSDNITAMPQDVDLFSVDVYSNDKNFTEEDMRLLWRNM
ncbi:hypothetical protein [Wohlfahrtiimonas chitiniclastica]|uniref:hypothetical protein n=1 Tax=Wohlfahrtiimonas chitiniclastica TaxID=400946 RepID=UPI001BCBC2E0|nr:hypothetical protein [Wohlfahrtiimonas chitiniclastica]MBS7837401.1 hypothetical protein [Wohlfahrtiimonas chitiniclastica]